MKRQEVYVKSQKIGQSQPTGTDHQEVEWQFDGADLERVEGWLGEGHEALGILAEAGEEKELTDTYYDTADWKLNRAGYALRIRGQSPRRFEATIKSLASAASSDDARRRREISETLRGEEPDALLKKKRLGCVGEHLKGLVGSRELRLLFEVRTRRRTFDLLEVQTGTADGSTLESRDDGSLVEIVQDDAGNIRREGVGSRVGEAALDETEIPVGDEPVHFARVEVEAKVSEADAASLDLLKEFARAMEEEFGLRPATVSKYELGLLAKGLDPEGDLALGPVAVKENLSADE